MKREPGEWEGASRNISNTGHDKSINQSSNQLKAMSTVNLMLIRKKQLPLKFCLSLFKPLQFKIGIFIRYSYVKKVLDLHFGPLNSMGIYFRLRERTFTSCKFIDAFYESFLPV
jgi:hypothetical protein